MCVCTRICVCVCVCVCVCGLTRQDIPVAIPDHIHRLLGFQLSSCLLSGSEMQLLKGKGGREEGGRRGGGGEEGGGRGKRQSCSQLGVQHVEGSTAPAPIYVYARYGRSQAAATTWRRPQPPTQPHLE